MVLNFLPQPNTPQEISNPFPVIFGHTTLKGMQVGTVLALLRGIQKIRIFPLAFINALPYTMSIGIGISSVMTAYMVSTGTLEKNQSRAFRIPRNPNQNRADDYMLLGGIAGLLLGRFIGRGYMRAFYLGCSVGTMANFAQVGQEYFKYNL